MEAKINIEDYLSDEELKEEAKIAFRQMCIAHWSERDKGEHEITRIAGNA